MRPRAPDEALSSTEERLDRLIDLTRASIVLNVSAMMRLLVQLGLATVNTNVWFDTLVVGGAAGPTYAVPVGTVGFLMSGELSTQLQTVGRVQVWRDDGLILDDPNLTDGELAPGYGWVPIDRTIRWTFTNTDPMLPRWFKSKAMIAWVDRAAWQEILDNLFTSAVFPTRITPA